MKLYYATSSLNFNDIFATESISPKTFYTKRTFGTKRHFQVDASLSDNFITLFSKMPYFDLAEGPRSSYEEYPIMFEIDIEEDKLIKLKEGIYLVANTIYLNINNVKLIFFSENEYNTILTKSNIVSEVKLIKKYTDKFIVRENLQLEKFKFNGAIPKSNQYKIKNTICTDRLFNNIKGFYYTYINSKYSDYLKNKGETNDNIEGISKIEDCLYFYENRNLGIDKKVIKSLSTALKSAINNTNMNNNNTINFLEIYHIDSENNVILKDKNLHTENELKAYQLIINCIFKKPKSKVGIIDKKEIESIIEEVGKKITEMFGEKSVYRNDSVIVYKRVVKRNFDYKVSSINSSILKNFLIFALKYDNYEELVEYLKNQKIEDKHVAYSFFGAFVGFSALSRGFTNNIVNCSNLEIIKKIDKIMDITYSKLKIIDLKKESLAVTEDNNERMIEQKIYEKIKDLRKSDNIRTLIDKPHFRINEYKEVKIEECEKNVEIIIFNLERDTIFNITLKHKLNSSKEERVKFKKIKTDRGIKGLHMGGNYPIYIYTKTIRDSIYELDKQDEVDLLESLSLIKV